MFEIIMIIFSIAVGMVTIFLAGAFCIVTSYVIYHKIKKWEKGINND